MTLASAAFASATFISCTQLIDPMAKTERVEIILPDDMALPPGFPSREAISWTVTWRDGIGTRRQSLGVHKRCSLALEKGIATAIVARPEIAFLGAPNDAAVPVGAIYPADAIATPTAITLRLDATGAIAALAAETVLSSRGVPESDARRIVSRINWKKFRMRVSALDTPGLFDFARFASAALAGRILGSSVSMRPTRELKVSLTRGTIAPDTVLVPEWPYGEWLRWPGGTEASMVLPDGLSRFLSEDGWLTVSVANGEVICAFYEYYSLRE